MGTWGCISCRSVPYCPGPCDHVCKQFHSSFIGAPPSPLGLPDIHFWEDGSGEELSKPPGRGLRVTLAKNSGPQSLICPWLSLAPCSHSMERGMARGYRTRMHQLPCSRGSATFYLVPPTTPIHISWEPCMGFGQAGP